MTWQDFDIFELEKEGFSRSFRELVLPIFQDSEASFDKRSDEIEANFKKATSKVTNEAEMEEAGAWADYQKHVLGQQKEVVGAALLNVVCSALRASLDSMSRYFAASHPRGDYGGRGWLENRRAEFKSRFGIDFNASPTDFTRIRELILARNAGVHNAPGTLREYEKNIPAPRFIANRSLVLREESLVASFEDANKFVQWVWGELKQIRSRNALADVSRAEASSGTAIPT